MNGQVIPTREQVVEALRTLRKKRDLSPEDVERLAKGAGGISARYIRRLEAGGELVSSPTITKLSILLKIYETDLDDFFGSMPPPTPIKNGRRKSA